MRLTISSLLLSLTLLGACSQTPRPADTDATAPVTVSTQQGTVTVQPTVVGYQIDEADDPLESINRPIFAFNHVLYRYLLNPIGRGYQAIMPDPAKQGVSNFFANLREPLNLVNNFAQGDGSGGFTNLGRFLINTTIGLAGLFDPATAWFDLPEDKASLNETLRHYDVGRGAFVVIPILGQSDLRNGASSFTESMFHPVHYTFEDPTDDQLLGFKALHDFSPRVKTYDELYDQAEDPYVFFRNLYLQGQMRDDAAQQPAEDEVNKDAADGGQ